MKLRQSTFQRDCVRVLLTIIVASAPINARATEAPDGYACAQVKPLGGDGTAPAAPLLLELFPELSGLLDMTAFRVSNKWMGESLLSPAILEAALALDGNRFEGEASIRFGVEGRVAFQVTKRKVAAPRDAMRAFLCAALQAPLEERTYRPFIAHTDDYPDLNFTFQGPTAPLKIFTESQPHVIHSQLVQTPWAISYADRSFVVFAADIDSALGRLLPLLDIRLFPEK